MSLKMQHGKGKHPQTSFRSIPSMVDGLKPGQRKIIFSCFKRKLKKEIKVAQLAGYVSEHSAYHHGEQALAQTIVNLAQVCMPGSECFFTFLTMHNLRIFRAATISTTFIPEVNLVLELRAAKITQAPVISSLVYQLSRARFSMRMMMPCSAISRKMDKLLSQSGMFPLYPPS